ERPNLQNSRRRSDCASHQSVGLGCAQRRRQHSDRRVQLLQVLQRFRQLRSALELAANFRRVVLGQLAGGEVRQSLKLVEANHLLLLPFWRGSDRAREPPALAPGATATSQFRGECPPPPLPLPAAVRASPPN